MYVCMYVYMCIHVYGYIYLYVCLCVFACACICVLYMSVHMYVCEYVYEHMCMFVCLYICVCVFLNACTCVYLCVCIYVSVCIHIVRVQVSISGSEGAYENAYKYGCAPIKENVMRDGVYKRLCGKVCVYAFPKLLASVSCFKEYKITPVPSQEIPDFPWVKDT